MRWFLLDFCILVLMSQNLKKAEKAFKKGEDNLTTGVFQWSKDYTSGASNFSEAGKNTWIQQNYFKAKVVMIKLSLLSDNSLSVMKKWLSTDISI